MFRRINTLPPTLLGLFLGVMLALVPTVAVLSYWHAEGEVRFYVGWSAAGVSVGPVCQSKGYQVWGDAATFAGKLLDACNH